MNDLRAALYFQLPTPTGNADDVAASLRHIATSRGWHVVAAVADRPISPASVRPAHPTLDALLRDTNFDVLVVRSLGHLAINVPELIKIVNELRSRGTALLVCDDGIDTTTEGGKSAFTAFAALAEFQRAQIRERSRVSLQRARRNGVRLGRPSNMNDSVRAAIHVLHGQGTSIRQIARQLRVGNATIYKALQAATTSTPVQPLRDVGNGFRSPLRRSEPGRNRIPA